jgi:hypothetical protein
VLKLSDEEGDDARGLTAVLKTLHSSVVAPCLLLMHERGQSATEPPSYPLPAVREKGDWAVSIHIHRPSLQQSPTDGSGGGDGEDEGEERNDNESGSFARASESDIVGGEEEKGKEVVPVDLNTGTRSTGSAGKETKHKLKNRKEDAMVTVRHSKRAASEVKVEAEDYFEFGWHVEMELDHELKRMVAVRLRVDDIQYGVNVDSDTRREIGAALRKTLE